MNMEVCVPSNAAQVFHMLRRQGLRKQRKPLIVMSPKSLLRHKDACSPLEDLANGSFQTVIGEVDKLDAEEGDARRAVLRQGLLRPAGGAAREEDRATSPSSASSSSIPFPKEHAGARNWPSIPKATEIVWCQEEPRNQGAWYWIASRHHLETQISAKQKLLLVSRPASSSPAVGYLAKHNEQQKALIESALGKIEY